MKRRLAVEAIVGMLLGVFLMLGLRSFAVTPYRIPSGSMEPTLDIGQRILVNRLAYDFDHAPEVGDVVVFHPPVGADRNFPEQCGVKEHGNDPTEFGIPCPRATPELSSTTYIKRIVAGPGQTLSVKNGHPVVDGVAETDEPYTLPCGDSFGCTLSRAITIPPGHYFLMGDNRGNSDDSRFWGPVPVSAILGKAFVSYWPPSRAGSL